MRIKHLYTLKKEYKDTDLYIWDVGRRSTWVFTYLAYRGIDVAGFAADTDRFAGETFMKRPVISAEAFSKLENAVLVLDDESVRSRIDDARSCGKAEKLHDILELDPDLAERYCKDRLAARGTNSDSGMREGGGLYIYGIGQKAWENFKLFERAGIGVSGFFITKKRPNHPDHIFGLPVIEVGSESGGESGDGAGGEFGDGSVGKGVAKGGALDKASALVISVIRSWDAEAILALLEKTGFDGDVYIDEIISRLEVQTSSFFLMLDKAVKEDRRVLLCCEDSSMRRLLDDTFKVYGIEPPRKVCFDGDTERGLDDIWSLADEDPENSLLLIHSFDEERRLEIREAAKDLGFAAGKGNFQSTLKANYSEMFTKGQLFYEYDEKLGAGIDYTPAGGAPGWAVHGNPDRPGKRIMILGGSTSSEIYDVESWASKLYKHCARDGKDVVIFNCAQEMDTVGVEMRRMAREIGKIRPDIVISMSGVNDMKTYADKFNYVRNEDRPGRWRKTEMYMKQIAESEGARFFAFLQPVNGCIQDTTFEENLKFITDSPWHGESFVELSKDDDFYTNLLTMFHHRDGMFIDFCHYSEQGTTEIADAVYETIKGEL